MPTLFQHRRLTSLIVFLSILLNLCAPAIGRAVTLASDPLAMDICSTTAARSNPAPTPDKQPAHSLKHCVFCVTHASGAAPPPTPAGLLAVLEGHDDYPQTPGTAPALPLAWSEAQPRGPPAAG
jgi:hypothetical protein